MKRRNFFSIFWNFLTLRCLCGTTISPLKTRLSKKVEYHSIRVRIPVDLWEKVQAKANDEYKIYAAFIVEILRKAMIE